MKDRSLEQNFLTKLYLDKTGLLIDCPFKLLFPREGLEGLLSLDLCLGLLGKESSEFTGCSELHKVIEQGKI